MRTAVDYLALTESEKSWVQFTFFSVCLCIQFNRVFFYCLFVRFFLVFYLLLHLLCESLLFLHLDFCLNCCILLHCATIFPCIFGFYKETAVCGKTNTNISEIQIPHWVSLYMTDTVFQFQQQQQWNRAHVSNVWSQNGHNHRSITKKRKYFIWN